MPFPYVFLYSYSFLLSVTLYFNMGSCLPHTWQLIQGVGEGEKLCRACGWVDGVLEGITFTGYYYPLPTPP